MSIHSTSIYSSNTNSHIMTNYLKCRCLCNKEDSNSCSKCNSCIDYKCLFNDKMLPAAWTNGNTPSKYVCAIFDSPNFILYCNNCLNSINDTSNSNYDAITISSIADKIDNIKNLILTT